MAIFHSLSASNSHPSMSMNIFPRFNRTNPIPVITSSSPTAQKWSIVEDLRLTSNPSNNTNYLTGFRSLNTTDEIPTRHEQMLKEVRNVLRGAGEDPLEGLVLIESLQRLGIDYHFQENIEGILQSQYEKSRVHGYSEDDLFTVSTRFRLLRQDGYNVPTDVFNNFMNKEGRFKAELRSDIKGLMGLYEASQLSIEGEDILDQAAEFSAQLLNGCNIKHLDHHQTRVVQNTLAHPYHKSLGRVMTKNFLTDYKGQNEWVNVLKEFAQMDFSMVQTMHQKEILRVSKWWKDTGLAKELKFARDQPLKWYMWPMASLSDPRFSEERFELTKPISFIYIIDDIFDVYGTLEELTLFTEAVNRWELADVKQLPEYMKICFKALHDITNEIAYKVYRKHGYNPMDSLRRSWASLCNAFLVEAKWFASGRLPKAEEYLKNGIVSSGVHVVLVHMFSLLGHGNNKERFNLLKENPGIITSTATILRLWDDLGSAKDENQDGHDGSYVHCYMKDHKGTSVETARKQVTHLISEAWKLLNRECLTQTRFSANFKKGCLNMARMVPLMYSYDDNHSLPILEEHMKTMLYDTTTSQRQEKYF